MTTLIEPERVNPAARFFGVIPVMERILSAQLARTLSAAADGAQMRGILENRP